MRTRFLTPNYFTAINETSPFLRLPLSPPSQKPLFLSSDELLFRCCNELSTIFVSLEVENLPINNALSKFYSDVLPHTIDPCYGRDFPITSSLGYSDSRIWEKEADSWPGEKEAQVDLVLDFETAETQSVEGRRMDATGDKNEYNAAIIQFEAPELTQYPENVCMSKEGEVQLLSELHDCDANLELPNLVPTDPFSFDGKDDLKSVEASCVEFDMTPELQIPDEVDLLPKNIHLNCSTLPLFEVEEIGPEELTCLCLEDEWVSLFKIIEEQHSVHSVHLELCCQDLLVSVEIDNLDLVSNSHSSSLPLEDRFTRLNLAIDTDLLRVIEISDREKSTEFVDASPIPFIEPFLFDEFKMLDSDSFDIFEAHAICQPTEGSDLGNMFLGDMPSKSFDDLIVRGELAVIDGTSTSLSVPDLVDDEKILPLQVIVDKILTELEPVPLSTSDEIYLDWHLLGRGECSGDVNVAFDKVLNDLGDYTIGANLKFDDGNTVMLDFLFSDVPSDEMKTREDKVIMPSGVNRAAKHQNDKVAPRVLPDDDCQIIENTGSLNTADFEKVVSGKFSDDDCQIIENDGKSDGNSHMLVSTAESKPQFNDLDFFLNPKRATGGMRTTQKIKSLDAKSTLSRSPHKKATIPSGSLQKQQEGEEPLILGPIKENCYKVFSEAPGVSNASCRPISCHTAQEPKPVHPCDLRLSDMIVIVNTQNFNKEMIISRRSTYQKILTSEKKGILVVERDLITPVDIILDFTTCIVWYDCKNIGKKATVEDEGASSIPLCIENIAANVLTFLSFVFTTCILIFEGERNFLGLVMESADELYAAAAGLGTNLQIFCSYSFELTDEIILNYFGRSRNIYQGLLSRLPESETLVESFLTKFPSINPLSAHAIISSGCMLLEFLELTAEGRAQILRKYHIPGEIINLFSALCKYGEREESKSGVTDCSSSISSPPDSGNVVRKINSEDRKRKFFSSSRDATYDMRCSMPCNKHVDDELNNEGMLRPSDLKVSKSPRIGLQEKLHDFFSDDEWFSEGDAPDMTTSMDPSKAFRETCNAGPPKIPLMADGLARSTLLVNDGYSCQPKSGSAMKNQREESAMDIFQDVHKDFVGEVLDFSDNALFEGFKLNEKNVKSSIMVSEPVKDHTFRHNRTARRLSFDSRSSDLNISTADGLDSRCGLSENGQVRDDNNINDFEYDWSNSDFKAQDQQDWLGQSLQEKSKQNFSTQLSKGKTVPPYGETPLSKAVHSGQLQQGSPWTMEFLNRIKEKRRLRQQIPPYASVLRTNNNPGNITKATKRRSPSILDYYKYQSDSTSRKVVEPKMQKQHAQLHNERQSGLRPTWTPNDKRARRNLSFSTTGTGSQTKLVWSDNITCSQDTRFSS